MVYFILLIVDPVQHSINPSVLPFRFKNLYSESLTSQHVVTDNSSFIHSTSNSSLNSIMNTSISNNSIRASPPHYQSPTSNFERSPSTSSQQPNSANITSIPFTTATTSTTTTPTNNNNNDDKPSVGFDREFSRLLYGKDSQNARRRRERRKAFSDPVK